METVSHFRGKFDAFNQDRIRIRDAELTAERHQNAIAYHRSASEVPECDSVSQFPHVHEPHDRKVGPYRVAAVGATVVGVAVAKQITESAATIDAASVLLGFDASTWKAGLMAVVAFVAFGKMVEAAFNAVARQTFFDRADPWYRWSLAAVSMSASVLLIARVANPGLAVLLEYVEPFSWLTLELSLVASAALAWTAAERFSWSRRFVATDREIEQALIAIRRRLAAASDADGIAAAPESA